MPARLFPHSGSLVSTGYPSYIGYGCIDVYKCKFTYVISQERVAVQVVEHTQESVCGCGLHRQGGPVSWNRKKLKQA